MTRLWYIIKEIWFNLFRHSGTMAGSFLSLLLLFLLFDLSWVGAGTSGKFYEQLVSELQMDVYLSESLSDSMIVELQDEVMAVEGVVSLAYISREIAREQLNHQIGVDLLVGYDTLNPLPRSLVLDFEPEYLTLDNMAHIEDKLALLPGITDINYSWRWLEKVERVKAITIRIGLVLGLLIILTVLLSSTNSIRLMARSRATGIRQMLLLGTGRMFIALPFLAEGFLIAGLAAVAGWGAILYGVERVTFSQFDIVLPTPTEIGYYCLACALLGLLSGWLGIRTELKEK